MDHAKIEECLEKDNKFDKGMRKILEFKRERKAEEQRVLFRISNGMVRKVTAEIDL
jgi:hypothetical protein